MKYIFNRYASDASNFKVFGKLETKHQESKSLLIYISMQGMWDNFGDKKSSFNSFYINFQEITLKLCVKD